MKPNRTIRFLAFCAAVATFAACNDWTEMETVDSKVEKPWEQDPALWAEYTAALRAYKQSEHFIVYARLHNSPEKASSEQDFMRCLPDSLDIVTLTNADNFSKFDAEDMDVMREKGTKVLYQVDYAARAEEFADMQALDAYLDQVVAAVALVQVLHVLQNGGGDALEACGAVGGQDLALDIIAQGLLTGQQVAHTF